MKSTFLFALACLVCLTPGAAPADAAPCLRIGVADDSVRNSRTPETVQAIFDRAHLCVRIVIAPPARIEVMESEGSLDGDAWRVESFFPAHGHMVMLPTPIRDFVGLMVWRKDRGEPRGKSARVGFVSGNFWAQKVLDSLQVEPVRLRSPVQLFHLATSGHIAGALMAEGVFRTMASGGTGQEMQTREVFREPLHLALNRHHEALLPQIDQALKALKAERALPAPDLQKVD